MPRHATFENNGRKRDITGGDTRRGVIQSTDIEGVHSERVL